MTPPHADIAIQLGNGHRAWLAWSERASKDKAANLPFGVIEAHGNCRILLPWASADPSVAPHLWNLVSLRPLTITPNVVCPTCGTSGSITGGTWIPDQRLPTEEGVS